MYILHKPIVKPEHTKTFNKLIKNLKLNIISLNIGYISNTLILIVLILILYFRII